jgi:DNA-directed RNA polymerase subunit M/transcription elongation factor TFIIS
VSNDTTKRSESPTCGQLTSMDEDIHCKRCGGAMVWSTVRSGDEPRFNVFRCLACDFYDMVKA